MKVSKISKKLIKPHTPTPQNLKNYKISFLDSCIGPMNFAVVLFYQSKPENNIQLEESLTKTLVQFYPLAGRYIMSDHLVDCSDQGVEFVEAEALDFVLSENMESDQRNALFPEQYQYFTDHDAPLLSIQATYFPCGGLAIAISVCHTIFDMSSLGTFISAWSNAATVGSTLTPSFDLPSMLPYKDHNYEIKGGHLSRQEDEYFVVKRFLFDKWALMRLKASLRPTRNGEMEISRVRVVSAVIAKALIGLDRGKPQNFAIVQSINMRERMIPPLPKHACGNFMIFSNGRVSVSQLEEIEMQELVDLIGDSLGKTIADGAEILSPNRDIGREIIVNNFTNVLYKELGNPDTKGIVFTDWSKFGLYKADFGWGKPVWTSIGPLRTRVTTILLMNNKDGDGLEAWVHLDKNDMLCFEQDEEIKLFTT